MSKAAETLDGWYSSRLFYTVDWTTFRLIAEDGCEVMITESETFVRDKTVAEESHQGDHAIYNITGQKVGLLLWFLRPEMKELNRIENKFNRLRIANYLIPTYSHVLVIELSNHLADRFDEDPYENPHVKARLYPELPHSEYIRFYPMDKRRNETCNWYMSSIEDRKTLMYNHRMIGCKYTGKIKQFITGSVDFDDYGWGATLFSNGALQFKKIIYEIRSDETTARYGEFGSSYISYILNIEDFK